MAETLLVSKNISVGAQAGPTRRVFHRMVFSGPPVTCRRDISAMETGFLANPGPVEAKLKHQPPARANDQERECAVAPIRLT
jgi:hypothetical protein